MSALSIASLNVRGMRDQAGRRRLYKYLKNLSYDVYLLQETHSTITDSKLWTMQWNGHCVWSHGSNLSRGTAILFNTGISCEISNNEIDKDGRYIILEVQLKGTSITLCSVYAPNTDSPDFFTDLLKHIDKMDYPDVIIGGDFNLVLDENLDRKECKETHTKALEVVKNNMEICNLTDVWRIKNTMQLQYTWRRRKCFSSKDYLQTRLDFFLVSANLANRVDTNMKPGFNSDHSVVTVTVQPTSPKRGPGFWKSNNLHLCKKDYCEGATEVFREAAKKYATSNPAIKWEMMKCEFTAYSKWYAVTAAKQRMEKFENLNSKISFLERQIVKKLPQHLNNCVINELECCLRDREEMLEDQVRKHILLSKTKWHQYGERNSQVFLCISQE